jgi:hypothetical protein
MSEQDRLVSNCLDPVGVESFEAQMLRLALINGPRTQAALKAVQRKKKIVELQRSASYQHASSRILKSLLLFAKGNYLSFGNLSGLLSDINGLRPAQPIMAELETTQTRLEAIQDIAVSVSSQPTAIGVETP